MDDFFEPSNKKNTERNSERNMESNMRRLKAKKMRREAFGTKKKKKKKHVEKRSKHLQTTQDIELVVSRKMIFTLCSRDQTNTQIHTHGHTHTHTYLKKPNLSVEACVVLTFDLLTSS